MNKIFNYYANDLTVRQCRLVDHNTAYEMMGNDELEGYPSIEWNVLVEWNDLGAYLFDDDINDATLLKSERVSQVFGGGKLTVQSVRDPDYEYLVGISIDVDNVDFETEDYLVSFSISVEDEITEVYFKQDKDRWLRLVAVN